MSKMVPMRCRTLMATRAPACPCIAWSNGEGVAICPDCSPSALRSEGSGQVCTSIKVATNNQTAVATAHAPNSQRDQTVVMELIRLRASLGQCCAPAWQPAIGTNTELPLYLIALRHTLWSSSLVNKGHRLHSFMNEVEDAPLLSVAL